MGFPEFALCSSRQYTKLPSICLKLMKKPSTDRFVVRKRTRETQISNSDNVEEHLSYNVIWNSRGVVFPQSSNAFDPGIVMSAKILLTRAYVILQDNSLCLKVGSAGMILTAI